MKKLVFTAIAVIAFSSVSIAQTDCETFAMDYIDEWDASNVGEEMDSVTAHDVYQELLDMCYTFME